MNFLERRDSTGTTRNQNGPLSRPQEKSDALTEASSGQHITLLMTNELIYTVFLLEEFWVSQTMQNISNNSHFHTAPKCDGTRIFLTHICTHFHSQNHSILKLTFFLKEIWRIQSDSKCV